MEYLKNYIKVGLDKIAKAYLYLAAIYQCQNNYKKASYFGNNVEHLNKIFLTNYQMYYIYDIKDKNIDVLKLILQHKPDIK